MGDNVVYYENSKIQEGKFICSSTQHDMTALDIVSKLINSESDIINFCKMNNIVNRWDGTDHIYHLVIKTFLFLSQKLKEGPL